MNGPNEQIKALGVDLGGTNIKAAVVTKSGEISAERSICTPASRAVDAVVEAILSLIRELERDHSGIIGIGMGAPGLVDNKRETIRESPNFPEWRNVSLKSLIEREINLPASLDNDVNCFALAEQHWGAGRGFQHLLALTVGTGVGGAVILNGRLYRGSSGAAGELGHISVDLWGPRCACGNYGCVERYVGNRWFVEAARVALDDDTLDSPESVSRRAREGDSEAIRFIENRGEILGVACVTLINIFDPQAIIIGGGTAQCGEPFFKGINRTINERVYPSLRKHVQVLPAKLGFMAGALGAALIGFKAGELS
jgi:glucokinase